jgi:hypothetical protein
MERVLNGMGKSFQTLSMALSAERILVKKNKHILAVGDTGNIFCLYS